MSRRDGSVYVGRLAKNTRTRDLEDIFEPYGKLLRCDIKYGSEMAYAFIDFEDRRDAEDCVKYEHGRELNGQSIIVEWAKGGKDRRMTRRPDSSSQGNDECFRCRRPGHWARDCPDSGWGRRGGGGGGGYGGGGGGYGGGRGGGGGGGRRWNSPSNRQRSRSRDRKRRSRSQSNDRRKRSNSRERKRSRSQSGGRKSSRSNSGSRKSRSGSDDRKKISRSVSREPKKASASRSRSKSPRHSNSKSHSKSPRLQQLENHTQPQADGDGAKEDRNGEREDGFPEDNDRRSRSGSKD